MSSTATGSLFNNKTHPYSPPGDTCAACPFYKNKPTNALTKFFNTAPLKHCDKCEVINGVIEKAGVATAQTGNDPQPAQRIEANRQKYNELNPDQWKKLYFDDETGGFVAAEHARIAQANKSKREMEKYKKEKAQCLVLAKNGYRVLHINDTGVIKYDAYVNDIASELKRLSSENNIENEAKDAIHVKKAKLVVFEFEKETRAIYKELDNLVKVKIHGMYWFKKRESKIYSF